MEYNLKNIVATIWERRKNRNISDVKSKYNGLEVTAGLGKGNLNYVPWISYCAQGQKTSDGIYPALLFYGTEEFRKTLKKDNHDKKIVLAYGISATNKTKSSWGRAIERGKTIKDLFKELDYQTDNQSVKRYNSSLVYKVYDWSDDLDYTKIQKDIDDLIDIYMDIIKTSNYIELEKIETDYMPSNNETFLIDKIIEAINGTGLIYSQPLIKRLAYSLLAKPFVILSGLAGSGKTQLALALAKCLSKNIDEQVCTVSIGADWTNREPLLGYPNALKNGEYVKPESGVLQLLMRAEKDPSMPYFLILDEMNLSVVERYFADFLSAMESGETIKLWDGAEEVPAKIKLPKNVFIIGTINVDETTYMFSPKVLDRANVIEFKIAPNEMENYLSKTVDIDLRKAYSACDYMAADFVNKAKSQVKKDDKQKEVLLSFFNELKKVNAEFGYRTVNEISRYLRFAAEDMGSDVAIDSAILQKLLPKLHGSRKKLVPVLSSMWQLCFKGGINKDINVEYNKEDFKYPESAEKIQRMYNAVIDNGFTSFAEA